MERKDFLKRCAALTAGVACLDLAMAGCATLPYARYTLDGADAVVAKADFTESGFVLLHVPSLPAPLYVARVAPDRYTALLLRCSHRGCTVRPAGEILECPCHGSRYSRHGDVLRGPAPHSLHQYPVTTNTEYVRIALSLS